MLACKTKQGGVSHVKLPSEGYRAIGGYSSYSIAVSRYTAPLRPEGGENLEDSKSSKAEEPQSWAEVTKKGAGKAKAKAKAKARAQPSMARPLCTFGARPDYAYQAEYVPPRKCAIASRWAVGRPIFIHHQCWEVLSFLTIQRQQCIKFRVLRAQDFYTPLPLNCQKGSTSQHWWCIKISLPAMRCQEAVSKDRKPRALSKCPEHSAMFDHSVRQRHTDIKALISAYHSARYIPDPGTRICFMGK